MTAAYNKQKEQLQVQVTDKGFCTTESEKRQLFKMFQKAEIMGDLNSEEISLGLIICLSIVEKSGGETRAFSRGIGKGSTFFFSMPMKEGGQFEDG